MHGVHAAERHDAKLDGNRSEASTETVDVETRASDTAVTLGLDCATRIGERARAVRHCSGSALDERRATRRCQLATGIGRHTCGNPRDHCGAQSGRARRIRAARCGTVRSGRFARSVEERRRLDEHARISALRRQERIRDEALDVRRGARRRNRKRSKTPSRAVEHHAAAGRTCQSARAARHRTKTDDARRAARTSRVGMRRGRGGDRTHNTGGAEDQRSGLRTRDLKGTRTGETRNERLRSTKVGDVMSKRRKCVIAHHAYMRKTRRCGTEEQRNIARRRLGRTTKRRQHIVHGVEERLPRKATTQRATDRVPGGKKPCTEHALRERRRRKACRRSQRALTQHERDEELAVVAEGAPVRGPNRKAAHARLEVSQDRGDTDKRHRDRVAVGDLRNTVERAGDGRSEKLALLCVPRNSGFRGRTRSAGGEEEREQLNTGD